MENATGLRERLIQRLKWRGGTEHIALDTRACVACGDCAKACPRGVLQLRGPFFHRHIHVVDAPSCTGCTRCVAACPEQVLRKRPRSAH